jgi:hypothetical protein
MAEHRDADPAKVLREAKRFWEGRRAEVKAIVAAQEEVYGYAKQSSATRNPTGGRTSTAVTSVARVPAPPGQPVARGR